MVSEVKRNVRKRLGNWNNVFAKGVRYACFIHYVRVFAGEVNDYDVRSENQTKDVLDDYAVLPYVVNAKATEVCRFTSIADRCVDRRKFGAERHHDNDKIGF